MGTAAKQHRPIAGGVFILSNLAETGGKAHDRAANYEILLLGYRLNKLAVYSPLFCYAAVRRQVAAEG